MKEHFNSFIEYIKKLNKKLKIAYLLFVFGIVFILIGSVKFVFFNGSSDDNGENVDTNLSEVNGNIVDFNNKNSSYIDIAIDAINFIKDKNTNNEFDYMAEDTLYLFSVGNGKYVDMNNSKKSPYGEWVYFYVGVTRDDNNGFEYYVLSLDDSDQGIDFKQDFELYVDQEYLLVNKVIMTELDFNEVYNNNEELKYSKTGEDGYLLSSELVGVDELLRLCFREKLVFVSSK